MNNIFRVISLVMSYLTLIKYKIRYGAGFKFSFSDRVASTLKIRISNGGSVVLGKNVSIREKCIISCTGGVIQVNDKVFFNDYVCLNSRDKIVVGSGTAVGQGVKIYDHDHDYRNNMREDFICSPVTVGEDVWIGSNVIILKGSNIGNGCVIGASSLVRGDVEPEHLYVNERRERFFKIEKNVAI